MSSTETHNNTVFNTQVDPLAERARELQPLWHMTAAERLATFNRGDMTRDQMFAWAARFPREVPRLNGEFIFIAASTPEACVCCPVCKDDEISLAAGGVLAKHPDRRNPFDPKNPYAQRPTCPASEVTPADAEGMTAIETLPVAQEPEYALAA